MPAPQNTSFDPLTQPLAGKHSIEASAGTGKTYSITLLWLRLMIEHGLDVDQILVSTFTKAATAELRDRLLASLRRAHASAIALKQGHEVADTPEARIILARTELADDGYAALCLRLANALSSFDLAPISTMHGFCQSLLSRHALELGNDSNLTLTDNCKRILQDVVDDLTMELAERDDIEPSELAQIADDVSKNPIAVHLYPDSEEKSPQQRIAEAVQQSVPQRKSNVGIRTFDDVLLTVRDALRAQGPDGPLACAVRSRLRAAIIDECQDSDGVQIEVFASLFLHPSTLSFIVIGDPKQSIYRFRGADLASYKKLVASTTPAPQMRVNHRSDPELVEAINALYGGAFHFPDALSEAQNRPPTSYVPVTANAKHSRIQDPGLVPALVFQWSDASDRQAAMADLSEQIARECLRLLSGDVLLEEKANPAASPPTLRPVVPGDIAILCNTHDELRTVRTRLLECGVPAQTSGAGLGSVFKSEEALDILAWLDLLTAFEKRHDVLGKLTAFLGTPLGALNAEELRQLRTDPQAQALHCASFVALLPEFARSGPIPLLSRRLAINKVVRANLLYAEGERRFTNWRHIASLLQLEHGRGRKDAASLRLWLARRIASGENSTAPEADSSEDSMSKLETDASAVQLVTVHNSKGLEYPVVFCPFLWSIKSTEKKMGGTTALVRQENDWILNLGNSDFDQHLAISITQEKEEEHRKLYVALTRAAHRLYIGVAPVTTKQAARHKNAASDSALVQLPGAGLAEANMDTWLEALRNVPMTAVLERSMQIKSNAVLTKHSPRNSGLSQLSPPQPIPFYGFSPARTASFTSLSKSDQDHSPASDRYDESEGDDTSGGENNDLLQGLGKGGAALGDQLHHLLEEYLGNHRDLSEILLGVDKAEVWCDILQKILAQPIPLPAQGDITLHSVRNTCITEMQFHLPLGVMSRTALSTALLADHAPGPSTAFSDWAKQISAWSFSDFTGFFQGYIDLIFEHESRWYIVDYKSNHLDDYDSDHLEAAMFEKNYLLQARLYALALHRHLAVHLPDYNYETHFGGVLYLFVRGFPSEGVWFERPSLSVTSALETLFTNTPATAQHA